MTIDQFIETANQLEPIRQLSDAHARNVATAFAEASTALAAAADVDVPDAGSIPTTTADAGPAHRNR